MASTVACAITSFVLTSRISKLVEVIINASGTVKIVLSPALTSLSLKSNVALILKVAHCAKSQSNFPPSLLEILKLVMASAKLPVTVGEVSAEAFREVREKSAAKNTNKNDKNAIFLVFFIFIPLFLVYW